MESTGNYVPYAGISFLAASDAMEEYKDAGVEVVIERDMGEGWQNVVRYVRGRV
jgi:hypothetical protein